jgi:hypothetical protein
VRGTITFADSHLWIFKPDLPWKEDEYYVSVNPQLEDVAGNNFNNAFDIDLSKETRRNSAEPVKRSFFIGSLLK